MRGSGHLPCERWRLCWRCRLKYKTINTEVIQGSYRGLTEVRYLCRRTNRRSHSESDAVAALLDEVDDVAVVEGVDVHVVHRQDAVSHLEASATFCGRTWNSQVQRVLGKCVAWDQILGQYLKLLKFAECIFSSLTPETSPGKLWEIFLW